MTLEELRNRIDVLDRQLVELLNERARAALMIGHLKAATSLPVYEPAREKVIYANVRAANKGPLPDIELTHIYERIIDVMRALQRNELASERHAQAAAARHATDVTSWRQQQGHAAGDRRCARDRERSNDRSHAGEGHRRADRCGHRRHGGSRSRRASHYRRNAKPFLPAWVPPPASTSANSKSLPGVLYVHRISSPYKLAGRGFRPEGTAVEFANGVKIGGDQVARDGWARAPSKAASRCFETAERVKAAGGSFLRGGAFKPRSSPYAFQGWAFPGWN